MNVEPNEHEPNIRMLRMLARSSFLVLLGPQRLVFLIMLSYFHIITRSQHQMVEVIFGAKSRSKTRFGLFTAIVLRTYSNHMSSSGNETDGKD